MCKKCSERPASFRPSNVTGSQLRGAIPEQLFAPNIPKSLFYLGRDMSMMVLFTGIVWTADNYLISYRDSASSRLGVWLMVARCFAWCSYWWFQGLVFTGLWLISHDCGHGSFFGHQFIDNFVGFVLHSFVGTPYYSWKYTHRQHHRFNGHVEKDAHWLPKIKEVKDEHSGTHAGIWDTIEDTPLFQLISLVAQQLIGFQVYLLFNATGRPSYPRSTNHFNPYSAHFRRSERLDIVLSDLGILATISFLVYASHRLDAWTVVRLYGIPWLALNQWISTIVALSHIDDKLPHYRDEAYTHTRGALVTVDRDFLGWQGKFFLHYVVHFHVVHHFFPAIPFYNLEEATHYAKKVLGSDYISCDTPTFRALWENFRRCKYVDSKGDIVFYKDNSGIARFHSANVKDAH